MKNTAKVVLIGAGAVGNSFLYAAINQGIASEYVIIDAFENIAEGNTLDFADSQAVLPNPFEKIKCGNYSDCKDADIIVITAGRPQKPGETRLEMVSGNARIMKLIAENIKASGFSGITIIASNPVDILTLIYQEVTGFNPNKVIGSGTTLDSARLRRLVAEKLGVSSIDVKAFLIGEHGDTAVPVWSQCEIMGQPLQKYIDDKRINQDDLDAAYHEAVNMAYKIIKLKRATYYGIGACLAKIVSAVLNDEKCTLMVGAKLNGEYQNKGLYVGVPAIVSKNGWEKIIEWKITVREQEMFNESCKTLKEIIDSVYQAIN